MQENQQIKEAINSGRTLLGIELGSTRIKAVLVDEHHTPLAQGAYNWENQLENGYWTYALEEVWHGLSHCYQELAEQVKEKYGQELTNIGAIGFSAMMHGYLPFDKAGKLLVPFRTWRNTRQEQASQELTKRFAFHIPQRFSIAHLYQAILNEEEHVGEIAYLTTLAGYVHWTLTGEKVLGIGEASGMFPIDSARYSYDQKMVKQFDDLIAHKGYGWKLEEILPKVLVAGQEAGVLSQKGASLLDPSGKLQPGIPLCPPEGDAGTGMVATNAVAERTGNVSAGTSVFSMVVLEKPLTKAYDEIDLVTTPTGPAVAMVHCNNCTSDLNAWVSLLQEVTESFGLSVDQNTLYETLYRKALEGDPACGNMLAYNYYSGEHITGMEEGRPLLVRTPESQFNLANFMRLHLSTALGALKVGNDLLRAEGVKIDRITAHGGLFKTKEVGQKLMAAALNVPVTVQETAGEGGAWGMAILAAYLWQKKEGETLEAYLEKRVFADKEGETICPEPGDVAGFDVFIKRYQAGLTIEKAAIAALP